MGNKVGNFFWVGQDAYVSYNLMMNKHSERWDYVIFKVKGSVIIVVAENGKRELRFEAGEVKGLLSPSGRLPLMMIKETQLSFRESTVLCILGGVNKMIIWQPLETAIRDGFPHRMKEDRLIGNQLSSHSDGKVGNKEEMKSMVPGVFTISWLDFSYMRVNVDFEAIRVETDHLPISFKVHPSCSYDKLQVEGDALQGKIIIWNVREVSCLKLMFPLPMILSHDVKDGGEVTLIKWRTNDDLAS